VQNGGLEKIIQTWPAPGQMFAAFGGHVGNALAVMDVRDTYQVKGVGQ
jgi:hypothetical protein